MASFVKLSVQDTFDNIQYFRNSDGSICGSSPIGFGTTQNANPSKEVAFSSLMDVFMDKYAKSFSKSSTPDETTEAQAKYIVNSLDTDKNGTISTNELNNFKNSNLNSNLDKQIYNLEDQFQIYDIDQDGELNIAEIKNAIGPKCYSNQELSQMAKEFKDNDVISKDAEPTIQASDFI